MHDGLMPNQKSFPPLNACESGEPACQNDSSCYEMTFWHVLIDQSQDGIVVLDSSGRVFESNKKFADMLGVSVPELRQFSVWDWDAMFSREQLIDILDVVDASGMSLQSKHRRKDGSVFDVEMTITGTVYRGKKLIFSICRDISDRKQLERDLLEREERFRQLSIVDELTGLYNSRHFYDQLEMETNRTNRHQQPLSLILLDIDDFKQFNDRYGHLEGDLVLARLGKVLSSCVRREDLAFRYGGEEFTILLPGTNRDGSSVLAEKIRTAFQAEKFIVHGHPERSMTVSVGVAEYHFGEQMKSFVGRADQAMYRAKGQGKNCVCTEI